MGRPKGRLVSGCLAGPRIPCPAPPTYRVSLHWQPRCSGLPWEVGDFVTRGHSWTQLWS